MDKKVLITIIIAVAVAVVAIGGVFTWQNFVNQKENKTVDIAGKIYNQQEQVLIKEMLGYWSSVDSGPSPAGFETLDPNCQHDGYTFQFDVDETNLIYRSYLHCRPAESGTWSLSGDKLTLNLNDTGYDQKISMTGDVLNLPDYGGDFKKVNDSSTIKDTQDILNRWEALVNKNSQQIKVGQSADLIPNGSQNDSDKYLNIKSPGKVDDNHYLVDLNNDGRLDLLEYATDPDWCGSGGCTLSIYKNQGDSFVSVGDMSIVQGVYIVDTYTKGWKDLVIAVGGGGYEGSGFIKIQYNGKEYPENPTTDGIEIPSSGSSVKIF